MPSRHRLKALSTWVGVGFSLVRLVRKGPSLALGRGGRNQLPPPPSSCRLHDEGACVGESNGQEQTGRWEVGCEDKYGRALLLRAVISSSLTSSKRTTTHPARTATITTSTKPTPHSTKPSTQKAKMCGGSCGCGDSCSCSGCSTHNK